jgi:hypothetical protein
MKYKRLLTLLSFCGSLFSFHAASAQLGEYVFSQTTETYTALTSANLPTDTVGAGNYLRRTYAVQLPFVFTLGNISSDTAWVDLAGFLALKKVGTAPTPQYTTNTFLPLTQMPYFNGIIAPAAGNFNITSNNGLGTGIRTGTSGTAPNRVFTIEWRNVRASNWNMQVKLHETTNAIDFCYSTSAIPTFTAEIGLRLADSSLLAGQAIARTNATVMTGTNLPRYSRLDTTTWQNEWLRRPMHQGVANFPANLKMTWTPPSPCNLNTANLQLPANMTICAGQYVQLRPEGFTSGLTYQWQVSANNSSWTNVTDGQGANGFQYRSARLRDTASRWYRLQATCTATQQAVYSNAVKVNATAVQTPYLEGFESITYDNQLPSCMDAGIQTAAINGYGWETVHNATPTAFKGSNYIRYSNVADGLYTPGVMLQAGKQYRFSFYYTIKAYATTDIDTLNIGIGSLPTPDSIRSISTKMITPVPDAQGMPLLSSQEKYRRMEIVFTVPTSGIYFGGILVSKSPPNTIPATLFDNLEIVEVPQTDVRIDSILKPWLPTNSCFNTSEPLTVKVTNAGTLPVSNIPVYFKSGPSFATVTYGPETITQTIAPGASIYYTFTQQVPLSNPTYYYKVSAWSALAADNYKLNDTSIVSSFQGSPVATIPYLQNFESGSFLGALDWQGNNTVFPVASSINSTKMMRINMGAIPQGGKDSASSVTIDNIAANTFLKFKYRMANLAGATATLPTSDTIYIVGVANCGAWRDTITKIHAGMQTSGTLLVDAPTYSLSAFAGNRMRVQFLVRKASAATNVYVDIDSFQVVPITPYDVNMVGAYLMPTVVCGSTQVPVGFILKNNGGYTATGFQIKALVNGAPSTFNYTYNGMLPHNTTDTINAGNLQLGTAGVYNVQFYVQQTNDGDHSNDTLKRSFYVLDAPAAVPSFDSSFCTSGRIALAMPDSTISLWYTGTPGVGRPAYIGNDTLSFTAADTFAVTAKRYVPLSAGPAEKHPNWSSSAIFTGYGLNFNSHSDFILDSVGVYVTGSGSITIDVVSCPDCPQPATLFTRSYNFSNATGTKQMLPIRSFIPAGGKFAIVLKSVNGISGIIRDFPFTGFPLTGASWPLTISSSRNAQGNFYDSYYYFYDIRVKPLSTCMATAGTVGVAIKSLPHPLFNFTYVGNTINTTNLSNGGGTYLWSFGDGNTSTAATPSHTYTTNGTYTLKLVQTNDCGKDSMQKTVIIAPNLGIGDVPEGWNALTAWPNPAQQEVFVSFTSNSNTEATLRVTDITGRTVLAPQNIAVKSGTNTIRQSLQGIAPGTYYLLLSSGSRKAGVMISVVK